MGKFVSLLDLPAGPCDFERIDLGSLSQAKQNSWVAGGHVAHAAFRSVRRWTNPPELSLSDAPIPSRLDLVPISNISSQ